MGWVAWQLLAIAKQGEAKWEDHSKKVATKSFWEMSMQIHKLDYTAWALPTFVNGLMACCDQVPSYEMGTHLPSKKYFVTDPINTSRYGREKCLQGLEAEPLSHNSADSQPQILSASLKHCVLN